MSKFCSGLSSNGGFYFGVPVNQAETGALNTHTHIHRPTQMALCLAPVVRKKDVALRWNRTWRLRCSIILLKPPHLLPPFNHEPAGSRTKLCSCFFQSSNSHLTESAGAGDHADLCPTGPGIDLHSLAKGMLALVGVLFRYSAAQSLC